MHRDALRTSELGDRNYLVLREDGAIKCVFEGNDCGRGTGGERSVRPLTIRRDEYSQMDVSPSDDVILDVGKGKVMLFKLALVFHGRE